MDSITQDQTEFLSAQLIVDVQELDAVRLIVRVIYDDNGNVISEIPQQEYDAEIERRRGKSVFLIKTAWGSNSLTVQSGLADKKSRADKLAWALGTIGNLIISNPPKK